MTVLVTPFVIVGGIIHVLLWPYFRWAARYTWWRKVSRRRRKYFLMSIIAGWLTLVAAVAIVAFDLLTVSHIKHDETLVSLIFPYVVAWLAAEVLSGSNAYYMCG